MQCNRFKTEIFFTLPICGLIFALACTCLISEQWVVGKAVSTSNEVGNIEYNFGLFRGFKFVKQAGSEEPYNLGSKQPTLAFVFFSIGNSLSYLSRVSGG
jgi:hypothetical protein